MLNTCDSILVELDSVTIWCKKLYLVPHLRGEGGKKVITFVLTLTHTQKQLKAIVPSRYFL